MPFSQTTLAQFTADISTALLDPANVHWQVDEIQRAIREGLLVWGALTSYWQDRGIFSTVTSPPTPFYDLSVQLPLLRSRAQTFEGLSREAQYHLYEASNGVSGTGMTSQFTIAQLMTALERARNEFIIEAKLPLNVLTGISPAPPASRIALPNNISTLSHAWWKDAASGIFKPLRRIDPWAEDSFQPDWPLNPSIPFAYSTIETPPLQLQLFPAAAASGSLSALTVQTIDYNASPPTNATTLNLPDEFSPAVKWGALYSMLSTDNEAYDPLRSAYAKQRWDSLVGAAASTMRSMLRTRLNNLPVPLDTVWALDATIPSWRNFLQRPTLCACAFDLLMFGPMPNQTYSVTVDVSRVAPLPVAPTDVIQMGSDELPYLFDYVRHILSFKLGGNEFISTMPLYDNYLRGAKQRNKIQTDRSTYLTPLFGQPRKEADQMLPA